MMLQFQDRCLAVESEIDKPLRTPAQCYRKFWDSVDNILPKVIYMKIPSILTLFLSPGEVEASCGMGK